MKKMVRAKRRAQFLHTSSFQDANVDALPSDASSRSYFRLKNGNRVALLMDAPPPEEDIESFIKVALHLSELGLSTPRLIEYNKNEGFLILEDFGNDTYTRLLCSGADEQCLYELAIDTLCYLHNNIKATEISIPEYSTSVLLEEAALLVDWYQPYIRGAESNESIKERYAKAWIEVICALPTPNNTLVLRDFHVDNLMRLQGRQGVSACGLLDFQDALIGASAYDVVSLLEDARRDLCPDLVANMLGRYCSGMHMTNSEITDFIKWYRVLGAQRHCKVLGIFVRLLRRDGKGTYMEHLPRVLELLRSHLDHEEMAPLRSWFKNDFPEVMGTA
jgi:aminoglycoside/choline kinase family phosphotransferase